jgi:carboxymethylenebutenolidase
MQNFLMTSKIGVLFLFVFLISTMFIVNPTISAEKASDKSDWVILSENESLSALNHQHISYLLSPFKQIQQGVSPDKIKCTEGLVLVLKQSTGATHCIKQSSVEKLIQRGWAIHILPSYSNKNNNSEIFKTGKYEVKSENVPYYDSAIGYLARPVSEESFPGVIMIHEWWGLNDNIKKMADKLASHGYIVFAVDLYDGHVATF